MGRCSDAAVARHKGGVYPQYDAAWYRRHHVTCVDKAAGFTVATFLAVAPVMVLLQARHVRSVSDAGRALWHATADSAGAALVTGTFMGCYCSLNNFLGVASQTTAMTSAAVAGGLLGAVFTRKSNPWSMPKLALGGVAVAFAVWHTTWFFQSIAEERQ